jgi:hypothetical protein
MNTMKYLTSTGCIAVLLSAVIPAKAIPSATADFSRSGSTLTITLTSTGDAAAVPTDILTGVYFSANDENLTPISAVLVSGSSILNPVAGESIGGNYQYAGGKDGMGLPNGATAGIVTTGLGVFGPTGNFGTPAQILDGFGYGIVNGISSNANNPVKDATLIDNSIVFTLTVPGDFDLSSIKNVGFQWGTSLDENPPSVPEGASTMGLLGLALVGLGCVRRKLAQA